MDPFLVIDLFIVFSLSLLAIAVLIQNGKDNLSRTFAFFVMSVGIWIISNYIGNNINLPNGTAEFATYFVFAFSYFAALSLLKIGIILSEDIEAGRYFKKLLIPLSAVGLMSFTPLIVQGVVLQGTVYAVIFGPLIGLYALSLLSIICALFVIVIRNRKKLNYEKQAKLNTFYYSLLLSLPLLLIAQFIIPTVFNWFGLTNIGIFATLILVFGLYYGVIKHRLFNLKLVVVRSMTYGFTILLLSIIYGIISNYASELLKGLSSDIIYTELLNITLIVFAVVIYGPLIKYFNKLTNQLFYRDSYNAQDFLNKINSKIVTNKDLHTLLDDVANEIQNTIKVSRASFYIDSNALIDFHTAGGDSTLFAKPEWGKFIDTFNKQETKIIYASSSDIEEKLHTEMRDLDVELVLKMTSKSDVVGYMLLSERKSGGAFNTQDIQLLEIIADELAITVQNMVQLEQIAQFNITLQKKIDDATKELQQTNEKLRSLDEAKDEFISMASHQLRTPLTSVKGYISMLLEGDAGDLNDTQKKFLDQAFISSQRMVYLIADLLNVSRLKTGKFVIEKTPTYLPDVVESEISQLYETAKARELNLEFKKPSEFVTLDLDETKTRQVIMNFVDNAIYYTPRGGKITVALKQLKNSVEYTVTDTGIGVPKKEQHHLFTKFYRAGNAKKSRPDGTGLGLYMAKKVIIAQGGHIIFKTQEGKGSTFGFSFPITEQP